MPTLLGPLQRINFNYLTWLALSKGPNRVGISLASSEYGRRCSFRNVVFSRYLEFRTMENVQKPIDSERCTASLETFRLEISTCFILSGERFCITDRIYGKNSEYSLAQLERERVNRVSETGFCLCFKVEPIRLDPVDRASPLRRKQNAVSETLYFK
jgi:hypothetical protein